MKLQFGIKSLLIATGLGGLWMGSVLAIPYVAAITLGEQHNTFSHLDPEWCALNATCYAPIWIPIIFVAYAIGRRQLTSKFVLAFILGMAVALGMVAIGFVWGDWRIARSKLPIPTEEDPFKDFSDDASQVVQPPH